MNDQSSMATAADIKGINEMNYWKKCKANEGTLSNGHYEYFYTEHFGLPRSFYQGKRIMDIGCGPRGSLEWADMTLARVGLDPLAGQYRQLGIEQHKMLYVCAGSESIPFPSAYFDVVCSFNSLDHVSDLDRSIAEIIRVTCTGGTFLLLSDLNHKPTPAEPTTFSWDIIERFKPAFEVLIERHFEKSSGMYQSVKAALPYNHHDPSERYGIISAMLRRSAQM